MTSEVPSIHVYDETKSVVRRPGMAGNIAIIGAFDSVSTTPQSFVTLNEAYESMGSDTTYAGVSAMEFLFIGASSLLCMNITTKTGSGDQEVVDKTMTVQKLTDALSKIKNEDFDILFVAETLTDTYLPIIAEFLEERYEMKLPAGFGGCLNGGTSSANITSAGLVGKHCYGILVQSFNVNGISLSLLNSAAYYCGLVAGMNVGNTLTMKTLEGVVGVSPEYTFETGDAGKAMVEAGITVVKCQNRTDRRYVVVNSKQPDDLDLYVNRVRDYVVKEFALHEFLGERNRQATLDEIEHELANVKNLCVNSLDLLEDIGYYVEKESSNCVGIHIESLMFAGIITRINMYVSLEVE